MGLIEQLAASRPAWITVGGLLMLGLVWAGRRIRESRPHSPSILNSRRSSPMPTSDDPPDHELTAARTSRDPAMAPEAPGQGGVEIHAPALPPTLIHVPRLGRDAFQSDPRDPASGELDELNRRHGLVYVMADGGASISKIAGQTGRTEGEIELILALRRRARSAESRKSPGVERSA